MTKRDIIKFLERKENEKTSAIQSDYEAKREQLIQSTYSKWGVPALADKIQPHLEEACKLWEDWKKKNENNDGLSIHAYYSLVPQLISATSSEDATYKKITGENLRLETKELEALKRECTNQLRGARTTYNTVSATVQQMKTAKQAAVYLKELGFDLSELSNPAEQVQTALMVPIDTRYLFVQAA